MTAQLCTGARHVYLVLGIPPNSLSGSMIAPHPSTVSSFIRRSGPPSNNSGVEWYNTSSTADFPSASSQDYAYNTMPGYNMAGANGSFEDEAPLLEGSTPYYKLLRL